MVVLYGIKNCDSVKKVRKLFEVQQISYTFHDFDQLGIDEKVITSWLQCGAKLDEIFNTKSTTYRQLGLKESPLDENQKLTLLTQHNRLIKRPVAILPSNEALVGVIAITNYFTPKQGK
jgi:arsenate reductase (glutaredoxin)